MKRKLIAALLALALLLTACGKSGVDTAAEPESKTPGGAGETEPAVTIGEPRIPSETELGYKSTVIEPPDWAEELKNRRTGAEARGRRQGPRALS